MNIISPMLDLMGKVDKSLNKGILVKISPIPPRSNQEKGSGSPFPKPTCSKCGRKHYRECLAGKKGCYGCGNEGYKNRDCPILRAKVREAKQASFRGLDPNSPN